MGKGRCAICGAIGPLSRDHVPPRGVVQPGPREIRTLAEYFGVKSARPRRAFTAVEFPTICSRCNSQHLGVAYDPELQRFCNAVASWVQARYSSGLHFGPSLEVRAKPARLARAVIGHLLAAEHRTTKWSNPREAPMPQAMQAYFLDPGAALPDKLRIYGWPYPSDRQVIIRGAGLAQYGKKSVLVGDFLKFFPIGFWVIWDQPPEVTIWLGEICPHGPLGLDEEHSIRLRLDVVPKIDWPEHQDGMGILLLADEHTVITQPKSSGPDAQG